MLNDDDEARECETRQSARTATYTSTTALPLAVYHLPLKSEVRPRRRRDRTFFVFRICASTRALSFSRFGFERAAPRRQLQPSTSWFFVFRFSFFAAEMVATRRARNCHFPVREQDGVVGTTLVHTCTYSYVYNIPTRIFLSLSTILYLI